MPSIRLLPIKKSKRVSERKLDQLFVEMHPRVFGALCRAISASLRGLDQVEVTHQERMLDILEWVTAAEKELGIAPGGFVRTPASSDWSSPNTALPQGQVRRAGLGVCPHGVNRRRETTSTVPPSSSAPERSPNHAIGPVLHALKPTCERPRPVATPGPVAGRWIKA